jgi:HK97 family phage major capsid protein
LTAAGSSANTGGSETGTTTLGSDDFKNAIGLLDQAYLNSEKCAWLMNRVTLNKIASVVTKQGLMLNLVQYIGGKPYIYGIPVKICPTLANSGSSAVPVILGDLAYWATRLIVGVDAGVRIYQEAPGLIENGKVGLKTFVRADGAILWNNVGNGAQSPFVYIMNHS